MNFRSFRLLMSICILCTLVLNVYLISEGLSIRTIVEPQFLCKVPDPATIVATGKSLFSSNLTLQRMDKLAEEHARNTSCYPTGRFQDSNDHLVIVVPFRNRGLDLLNFVLYMTPFLRRNGIKYNIVVAEQNGTRPFNRAKLFNAAVREIYNATEEGDPLTNATCFALHDVDKLPIHKDTPYTCHFRPHQLMRMVTYKEGFHRTYRGFLGGVTLFNRAHLEAMNGASNDFEGWGGEDDDLYARVRYAHYWPLLARFDVGQFYEEDGANHVRDKSPVRFDQLAKSSPAYMKANGLRQTRYRLLHRTDFETFTWMLLAI